MVAWHEVHNHPVPLGRIASFYAIPGTSCQAAFADYGAPDNQRFAQLSFAVAT